MRFPCVTSLRMALGLTIAAGLTGCGGSAPFAIAPVSGKVTFDDGSLIPGDRIVIRLIPEDVKSVGKDVPAAAMGDLNPADGTFAGLTTLKFQDGAIPGKHKVVIEAFTKDAGGNPAPSDAIPEKYRSATTTTLTQEIPSGGKRDIHIQVPKK